MSVQAWIDQGVWVRWLLQRGLGAIYLLAFCSALNQFPALLGEHGLLPVPRWLPTVSFWKAPSLFHLHYSDPAFRGLAWAGILLSLLALFGLSDAGPLWLSVGVWATLWVLYLSIVNVGQTFYAFGWESMLLEAGFFAVFMGPTGLAPSFVPILALRFMLFRTELGAGLIKLRHDSCWRDLTCLYYHYETQPLPNPLSWYFHHLPRWVHRSGVVFSHFVQIVVPFSLVLPQPWAACGAVLIIGHQLLLIVSGNYAWLNWLTVVIGISALPESWLQAVFPAASPVHAPGPWWEAVQYALGALTVALGIQPTLNLTHAHQRMNCSYNSLHLVNAYGAFGSVTRERHEVVIEGAAADGEWKEYGLRGKPGELGRRPAWVAPYHLRLDWAMWFLPLRLSQRPPGWFSRLMFHLLEGDEHSLRLFKHNPFAQAPPQRVRALLYTYRFSTRAERKRERVWWTRERIAELWSAERDALTLSLKAQAWDSAPRLRTRGHG